MRVPQHEYLLEGGLRCRPRDVEPHVAQAHLIKHPVGMGSLHASSIGGMKRSWNEEGWDRTTPPVLTVEQRRELVARIQQLEIDGKRCAVPRVHKEEYGGESNNEAECCYQCDRALASACADTTTHERTAYLATVDDLLECLVEGRAVRVTHAELQARVLSNLRSTSHLVGLVVLAIRPSATQTPRGRIARVSSWHGVRSEFFVEGGTMTWRTTYRADTGSPATAYRHLVAESFSTLSESVIVPRPWWEGEATHAR